MKTGRSTAEYPLCVDLDGTLVKSDVLAEAFFAAIKSNPLLLCYAPIWLLRGKAYFKEKIAEKADINIEYLPFHDSFLSWLREEHAQGRRLILVTAAPQRYANLIAQHLGLFTEVFSTTSGHNLSGSNKAKVLLDKFGDKGFDYAANARIDIAVWRHARQAILVNPSRRLKDAVEKVSPIAQTYDDRPNWLTELVKALRIHQWLKNVLVFVPLAAAHKITDWQLSTYASVGFFAYGLCASSAYLLNDLLDLPADRQHPEKRNRPFAAGQLSLITGMLAVPLLLLLAVILSLVILPPIFLLVLLTYYTGTLLYSFLIKHRITVDVLVLAGLYTMRIIAGAAAITIMPSFWLLAFSMFLFLSLALVKRCSELIRTKYAGKKRPAGRGYRISDLPVLLAIGAASGYQAVLVLALYLNSPDVNLLYSKPKALWLLCPLLLFWISRIWTKAYRGEVHDDPVVFAIIDKASIVTGLIFIGVLFIAT